MSYLEKETKEKVMAKISKKVKIGNQEFPSMVASAKFLKKSTHFVKYYIRKGNLPDGTPISFIK